MASDESALTRLGRRDLVESMHRQLDELLVARDQTEELFHAILGIGADLDLDATLDRIVTAAMRLTGARYGALGVRGHDRALSSFLHKGIDTTTAQRIGDLPVGKGLLGEALEDAPALRVADITDHPAAAGFPPHHPPMHAFLGVPITVRGHVFGSLYITHDQPGRTFTESDEVATRVLASAAAAAIDNAQLFERVRASARWTRVSREITTALLSGATAPQPLTLIAQRACELTAAEQAIVLVPDELDPSEEVHTLVVSAAVGILADQVMGQRVPVDQSSSGAVFRSGEPVIIESFRHPIQAFTDVGQRPAILMPLCAGAAVIGVIAVARHKDALPFDPTYLELVADFASHAAIALTLASARAREHDLLVVADRERIAHDLHDHVIQRMFAAGLDLQGTIARTTDPQVRHRLSQTVDDLQNTIETIRSTIFELQSPLSSGQDFRSRLQQLIADLTDDRELTVSVHMSGLLSAITGPLAEHAEAVAAEAISNAVRHSGATHLTVTVSVEDALCLEVRDDGDGIPAGNRRASGLTNMRRRAETLGGTCQIGPGTDSGGTIVRWTAPLLAG